MTSNAPIPQAAETASKDLLAGLGKRYRNILTRKELDAILHPPTPSISHQENMQALLEWMAKHPLTPDELEDAKDFDRILDDLNLGDMKNLFGED